MNEHFSPQDDEQFCRDLLAAANAHDDKIEAALESPFVYQRIRREIAAQTQPRTVPRSTFIETLWHWRWAFAAAAAVCLLAIGGWRLWQPQHATLVAKSESPGPIVAAIQPPQTEENSTTPSVVLPAKRTLPIVRHPRRTRQTPPVRSQEVTTEFIPLSYVADASNAGGHLIRVEVTPALLASLGLPLKPERNMEWIKADVVLGDDGLARAIRFVQ